MSFIPISRQRYEIQDKHLSKILELRAWQQDAMKYLESATKRRNVIFSGHSFRDENPVFVNLICIVTCGKISSTSTYPAIHE